MSTITVSKFIWDFTGQAAHLMAGYIAISTFKQHTRERTTLIAVAAGLGAAAFKEFWWDYQYEDAATRGSSLLDFSMYAAGIALGFFL